MQVLPQGMQRETSGRTGTLTLTLRDVTIFNLDK